MTLPYYRWFVFFLLVLILNACTSEIPKADVIITNAKIWTGEASQPTATSMAIASDTILAIGSGDDIEQYKHEHTVIKNLEGRMVMPGFIDAHVHLLMGGNALLSVELRDAKTKEEFITRIAEYANTLSDGEWILEGNWDHTLWGGTLPTKEWIDEFTQDIPLVIYRIDGHMVLANSKALEIAGFNKNSADMVAGEIVRYSDGRLTGILKGSAMTKMLNAIPPMTASKKENALKAAANYLLANGITSVHDMDSLGTYGTAKRMLDNGELNIRIYAARPLVHYNKSGNFHQKSPESKDAKWLKTGLLKGFVDGSLGSHTAAFLQEYSDKKGDYGFFLIDQKALNSWISIADFDNKHIAIHAIGDRANNTLLNIFESVIKEHGPKDRRFRIEHAQHLKPADILRFADLNVIASVQPYHIIDDGRWAEAVIGPDRIKSTYAFKSLIVDGTLLAFGSDWPVAPASPLMGIYAATTRQTLDGKNPEGWISAQAISVQQAMLAYTKNAAFASFDEKTKGTLAVGKLADFVILSDDITKTKADEIKNITVLETYVGGKLMFEKKANHTTK